MCIDQLFEYYTALGMPPEAVQRIEPIQNTSIPGGVEIVFGFEAISRIYQSFTPSLSGSPQPIVDYISFNRPWCVTSIEVVCGGTMLNNLPKNSSCPVIDYDTHDEVLAGRSFIYNPEASGIAIPPGCNGDIVIRLFGDVVLGPDPGGIFTNAFYTFSLAGLPPRFTNLNLSAAVAEYQASLCVATPTVEAPTVPEGQYQLVCAGVHIGCRVTPRPGTSKELLVPVPSFACVGTVPGLPNQTFLVWHVDIQAQTSSTNSIDYCISFCEGFNDQCVLNETRKCQQGFAGTRAQFVTNYTSFDNVEVLEYRGNTSYSRPTYPPNVRDPFIRAVPCVCGFSIDCHGENNTINLFEISKILAQNNAGPQARAVDGNIFILPGVQNVSLSLWPSFDPDNQPNPLTYLWEIYNTTPSPVTIDNPRAPNITVSGNFTLGVYRFIGRVSDGQLTDYILVNVTVQLNVIIIVLERYKEVQYILKNRCPPPGQLPNISDAIILNGSASFGLNPSIPLFYNWTQIAGDPITIPFSCDPANVTYYNLEAFFNTNESIAYFIPRTLGIYVFRLTICDNGTSPCRFQDIHVSVELNFDGPNSTRNNYTDFPDAPIYNVTNRSVPTITFVPTENAPFQGITRPPSFSQPPVNTQEPVPTTTVPSVPTIPPAFPLPQPIVTPAIFPTLPPPSMAEKATLFLAFIGVLAVLVVLFGFCITEAREDKTSQFDRIKVYQ